MRTKGILLLYHRPPFCSDASTIMDNVTAFQKYSKYDMYEVNTHNGFPGILNDLLFDAIVLHYTLFGRGFDYELSDQYYDYIQRSTSSYKIALFQDEYRYCQKRFKFINDHRINMVYTCFEDRYHKDTYEKFTNVNKIITYIPGYVSDTMIYQGSQYLHSSNERPIDIGYRARKLDYYMGVGAQEKHRIGIDFLRLSKEKKISLRVDVDVEEKSRIYGSKWYQFIGSCKSMLGVESGVSLVDLHDSVRLTCNKIMDESPGISFEELHKTYLYKYDNNIPLRTISPRHFECASFGTCQILFEGNYSGIMRPYIHYIPLRKDFSNFDEVINLILDSEMRRNITKRAFDDLIASEKYTYKKFTENFDARLVREGILPARDSKYRDIQAKLKSNEIIRKIISFSIDYARFGRYPGKRVLKYIINQLGLRRITGER